MSIAPRTSIWLVCLALTLALFPTTSQAQTPQTAYYVAPTGDDDNPGTRTAPFATIQEALDTAGPGSTIFLAAGQYQEDVRTRRAGLPGQPITLTGPRSAVVRGDDGSRIFQLNHSYITLDGFTLDGTQDDGTFRDALILGQSQEVQTPLRGLRIRNMILLNANDQCIRLRYYVQDAEIAYNRISLCGQEDFPNGIWTGIGKTGEGIFIGTPPDQQERNPEPGPDLSQNIHIHHNTITTFGNECVEIRENAANILIEYNYCRRQFDPDAAGFNVRGNGNILRYNTIYRNAGSGIRLGGETEAFGINNAVYGNQIIDNMYGPMNIQRHPQQIICGNALLANGPRTGRFGADYPPDAPCPPGIMEDLISFTATGFGVYGQMREFWEQNGGVDTFGLPISPVQVAIVEGEPRLVQWFERSRLELHPDNLPPFTIIPGRLGVERLAQRGYAWQSVPPEAPQAGCRFFAETGRNVCGAILRVWQSNGLEQDGIAGFSETENLALFGLPLTGVLTETLGDGREYQVQYFERVRLELHPDNQPPANVLIGLLGREVLGTPSQ